MKYSALLLCFLLTSVIRLHAQTDSTYTGKWKCTVDAGNKGTSVSYLWLKTDSSFVAGADSTFKDMSKQTAKGKWCVTSSGDLKLIPSDTSKDTHYFKHADHWKFHYYMNEKHGRTSVVQLMEMDIYVEKIIPQQKKGKTKKAKSKS